MNLKQKQISRQWAARWIGAALFIVLSISAAQTQAYQGPEHTDIATRGQILYVAHVAANPGTCVGAAAIQNPAHSADFLWGALNEDVGTVTDPAPYLQHFYDPLTGTGLPGASYGFYTSAVVRAQTYWSEDVLPCYKEGRYAEAYRFLGRVAHLVSDMGVPAHTNLDPHGGFGGGGTDFYEGTYIANAPANYVRATSIASNVSALMLPVATASRKFDSDDVNGAAVTGPADAGARRAGGFTNAKCVPIATVCYPKAEAAVGGLLKLFYDTIQPKGSLHFPEEGQVHSGIKGVPLKSRFRSYGAQGSEADQMARVEYHYSTKDDAVWQQDFTACGIASIRDAELYFAVDWTNSINDIKVWLNSVGFDNGGCESLTSDSTTLTPISIDSKRPQVTNTKP